MHMDVDSFHFAYYMTCKPIHVDSADLFGPNNNIIGREWRSSLSEQEGAAATQQATLHLYWPPGPHRHIGAAETRLARFKIVVCSGVCAKFF